MDTLLEERHSHEGDITAALQISPAPTPAVKQASNNSTNTNVSTALSTSLESEDSTLLGMPFPHGMEGDPLPVVPAPAKPLLRPSTLSETCFILPGYKVFIDKILPPTSISLEQSREFPLDYFISLHNLVSAATSVYPAYTPNYCGARIPLRHTGLNISRWRHHLIGYEDSDITQFLEFGFPLGLTEATPPSLVSTLRNHGSSYQYFTYLEKFLSTGLERRELAGPCIVPPFSDVHISPLMTAVKKPAGRRAVFDASFGEQSLNNGTPPGVYLSQPFTYDFPRIEDFKRFILECGQGCYIWKRDLSRYYLQLPLDPTEYPLVCFVW